MLFNQILLLDIPFLALFFYYKYVFEVFEYDKSILNIFS